MENPVRQLTDTQKLVSQFYKDDSGNPIILTKGQDAIFRSLAMKINPRVHIMCHTRYGKSMTVGLAVLTRAATYPEKWGIIAGTKEKAKIIMEYIIQHIFDNDYTKGKFVLEGESEEEVRRHRSKSHLTFKVGKSPEGKDLLSEIFIGGAKDVLGFGAPNVVEDEAALIEDPEHSLVLRMLGDNPHDNFMAKIGNPFNRNHFLRSYHDPKYKKIVIDCYYSLKEGRMTQEMIEENRPYSFFNVLYECKFPSAQDIDESGWLTLFTDKDILDANKRSETVQPNGERRLGLDVARGGRNYNVWCLRQGNVARILRKDLDDNLVSTAETTVQLMRDNGVDSSNVFVDDSGVGGGVTDYLKSVGIDISPVNFGERAETEGYLNVKAEVYAGPEGLSTWLKSGGALVPHKDWIELARIRYKKDAAGHTKIEPKEELRKRGYESPDVADALALTFAKQNITVYHGVDPSVILAGGVKPYFEGMPG